MKVEARAEATRVVRRGVVVDRLNLGREPEGLLLSDDGRETGQASNWAVKGGSAELLQTGPSVEAREKSGRYAETRS
jgi:hypothetical protein